jgi:hypothetical protein
MARFPTLPLALQWLLPISSFAIISIHHMTSKMQLEVVWGYKDVIDRVREDVGAQAFHQYKTTAVKLCCKATSNDCLPFVKFAQLCYQSCIRRENTANLPLIVTPLPYVPIDAVCGRPKSDYNLTISFVHCISCILCFISSA